MDDARTATDDVPPTAPAAPTGTEPSGAAQANGGNRLVRLASRAGWNVADQVLSALTNAVLTVLVARAVKGSATYDIQVSSFATAFYLFSLLIGIERALVGQVLQIRHSGDTGDRWRDVLGRAMGNTLAVTGVGSVVMALAGLGFGGTLGATLVATAVVMPFAVLQDACRMAFFTQSNSKLATLNDALWAVVQFAAIGALMWTGTATVVTLVLVWGGAAGIAIVVALRQLRVVPRISRARQWLRDSWDISGFMLGEYLLGAGAFNGGYLIVGAIAGGDATYVLRAAQVLLGPLGILASGLITFALPELSRRTWLTARARMKVALAVTGIMLAMAAVYTTALLLLPHSVGEFLFSESWDSAAKVILPVAIGSTGAAISLGPAINIYALGQARKTFRIMMIEAPLVFVFMLSGAAMGGVVGAAWGLALDQCLMVPLWFLQLRAILRDHERGTLEGAPGSADPVAGDGAQAATS